MSKKKLTMPWILAIILLLVLVGGGVYAYQDIKAQKTLQQAQSAQRNPALRAAMSLLRLQRNPQLALTQEQKTKLIPVIQELINTKNPSADFLKEKAKQINDTLTDAQKAMPDNARRGQGTQGGQGSQGAENGGQGGQEGQGGQGGQGGMGGQGSQGGMGGQGNWNRSGAQGQPGNAMNPVDLYKRVLESLQ